jgi:hypothetical protein
MSSKIVEQWFQRIPSLERNQPLITLGNTAYSPNQVLDEVTRGTPLGADLQRIIEQRRFSDVIDKYALAILRLKDRLKKMPPDSRLVVGTRAYSPSQAIEEIQGGTRVGRSLIEAEVRRVEEVLG